MQALQQLQVDSPLIELYVLDCTGIGGSVYRFTPHFAEAGSISFAGNVYTSLPIKSEGWEVSANGSQPRPTLTVSNVSQTLLNAVITLGDIVGAKLTRIRTLAKYLDASAFVRRNLVNWSESFNTVTSGWGVARIAISANQTTAPNGTLTADRITEDTQTGAHHMNSATTLLTSMTDNTVATMSVYLKAGERTRASLSIYRRDNTYANHVVNLSTGATISITSGYTGQVLDVGNGWYRVTITGSFLAGVNVPRLHVFLYNNSNQSSYTGDGTSGLFAWGAQAEINGAATDYQYTTTTHQPFADGNQFLQPEIFYVEQKVAHDKNVIAWQLASVLDRFGTRLPRRQITKDYFPGVGRQRGAW